MSSENWASGDEWDEFVRNVRKNLVHEIDESAFVMSLVPRRGQVDVKFAVELGLSLMLDKPIIAVVLPGAEMPDRLRRAVDRVVEVDIDTEAGQHELARVIKEHLGGIS